MKRGRKQIRVEGGFSYLELQVSMVLLAIALSGLAPLSVLQSRQIRRVEAALEPGRTRYLAPAGSDWARKLGVAAEVTSSPPPRSLEPLMVVDDGDEGYSEFRVGGRGWHTVGWPSAVGKDMRLNSSVPRGDRAKWEFTELPRGNFEVLVSYSPFGFLTRRAEYELHDEHGLLRTVRVNQQNAPSGPRLDGVRWESLGTVSLVNGYLRVELPDSRRNYIYIDAVRIRPSRMELEIMAVEAPLHQDSASVSVHVFQ